MRFLDFDDEGIQKDVVLFRSDFTATADHDPFAVSDRDLAKCIGVVEVLAFVDFGNNQIGQATPALSYHAPEGILHAQIVTRGADTIAAKADPLLEMVILE